MVLRWVLAGLILGIAVAYYAFGGVPARTTLATLRGQLGTLGAAQYLVVILITASGVAGMVPSTLFTFSAVSLYGPEQGFLLMVVGQNLGAALARIGVRFIAQGPFLTRMTELSRRHPDLSPPLLNVVVRLTPLPFAQMNYCMALLPMRFTTYLITTAVGAAPLTFVAAMAYGGVLNSLGLRTDSSGFTDPSLVAASVIAYLGIGIVAFLLHRRRTRGLDGRDQE